MSSSVERSVNRTPRRRVAGERSRARSVETTRPQAPRKAAPAPQPAPRHTASKPVATDVVPAGPAKGPAHVPHAAPAPVEGQAGTTASGGRRRRLLVPGVALAAALAVLAGVAGLSWAAPSAQAAQTRAATSAARTSIEQMLSYNHATIDAQAARVEGLLTGAFKSEFATAMREEITPLAVKNKTVVQAKVSDIGVMEQAEGRVKVLAFVNQATVGADQKQPAVDQNRVIATLTKVGDRWLISDVQAF